MAISNAITKFSITATGAILMALGTGGWGKPANAASFTGTSSCQDPTCSPTITEPSPRFGTLINFDDLTGSGLDPANTPIPLASNQYASLGVTSITTSATDPLAVLNTSYQSLANQISTFDFFPNPGSILLEFANLQSQVGIGLLSSAGLGPNTVTLNIYDEGHNLIESSDLTITPDLDPNAPANSINSYAGFSLLSPAIKYFEIVGSNYAVDDLQFIAGTIPEPSSVVGILAFGVLGSGFLFKRR